MTMSGAERQRKYKERLKAEAAESKEMGGNLGELVPRLEQAVHLVESKAAAPQPSAMPQQPNVLHLSADHAEQLIRLKQARYYRADGSVPPEAERERFLGLTAQQWIEMPDEILAVFGLADVIAGWVREINEDIAADRLRQPEGVDIERHLAQQAADEGRSDPPAQELVAIPEPRKAIEAGVIKRAYRRWVRENCPHPLLSA